VNARHLAADIREAARLLADAIEDHERSDGSCIFYLVKRTEAMKKLLAKVGEIEL
jgi:hypothetical protein